MLDLYWRLRSTEAIQKRIDSGDKTLLSRTLFYEVIPNLTPEKVASNLQALSMDSCDGSIDKEKIDFLILPAIRDGDMVLNVRTGETRIVRATLGTSGKISVYNSDHPNTAERQKHGYMAIYQEQWDLHDVVKIDRDAAREEGYVLGSPFGLHPRMCMIYKTDVTVIDDPFAEEE